VAVSASSVEPSENAFHEGGSVRAGVGARSGAGASDRTRRKRAASPVRLRRRGERGGSDVRDRGLSQAGRRACIRVEDCLYFAFGGELPDARHL